MFQPVAPRAAPFFDQQAAQFFNGQIFGRFPSGHGEADYTAWFRGLLCAKLGHWEFP
jgi:hypothetical protein